MSSRLSYLVLIQDNTRTEPTDAEWIDFITTARESGMFEGGSTIGERVLLGESGSARSTRHVVGFMRFDTDDRQRLLDLLETHPVVRRGGSIELCELPRDGG